MQSVAHVAAIPTILENTLIVLFPLRLPSVELRTLPNSGVNVSLKRE